MKSENVVGRWKVLVLIGLLVIGFHSLLASPKLNTGCHCICGRANVNVGGALWQQYYGTDGPGGTCYVTNTYSPTVEWHPCDGPINANGLAYAGSVDCDEEQSDVLNINVGNTGMVVDGPFTDDNGIHYYTIHAPDDSSKIHEGIITLTSTVTGTCNVADITDPDNPPPPDCQPQTMTATGFIHVNTSCDGTCSAPDAPSLSTAQVDNNSVDFSLNLGPATPRLSAGTISLEVTVPSANMGNPALLQLPDYQPGVFALPNVTVIPSTPGVLQQVKVPEGLVSVNVSNSYTYQLDCYYAANVGSIGGGGLYTTTGSPYASWVFQNPDGGSAYNRLWITEVRSTVTNLFQYTYVSASNRWDLLKPDGQTLSTWFVPSVSDPTITNYFRQVSAGGQILSLTQRTCQYISALGHSVILQQVDGTGGVTQTTTYSYYGNDGTGNANKLQEVVYPDGKWIYDVYDSQARKHIEYSAYGNSAAPTPGTQPDPLTAHCRETDYAYDIAENPVDPTLPYQTAVILPVLVSGTWQTNEVSRSYESKFISGGEVDDWIVKCPYPGASFSDANNLVTATYTYYTTDYQNGLPFLINHPDGTSTSYTYADQYTTTETDPDGSTATTIVDAFGKVQTKVRTISAADTGANVTLEDLVYTYLDNLEQSYQVIDLAGRTTSYNYDCCNVASVTDPDGMTTTYGYNALKRRITSAVNFGGTGLITTTNTLDPLGNVLVTQRIGTNGNTITLGQSQYDVLSRVVRQTNALNGVTITAYLLINSGTQLCISNTYPDGGTRVETYYSDGRLQSVAGTAVMPAQYSYGLEQDGGSGPWREYTLTVKLSATGGTNEWTKTYADGIGRPYKTIYAKASGAPYAISYFNSYGQLTQRIDPDNDSTLYTYDAAGRLAETVLDMNQNNTIDSDGSDRISLTTQDVASDDTVSGSGVGVTRTRVSAWNPNTSSFQLFTTQETSANALTNWNVVWNNSSPVTSESVTAYDFTGHYRYVTNTAPDGSYTLTTYLYGRLLSMAHKGSDNSTVKLTTYGYDAHGRQSAFTDARNGTTTYTFNNADQVVSVTTPTPGGLASSPETTTSYYDNTGRLTGTLQPDNTTVTNLYYVTGLLNQTHGSRTYPVGYGYDAQGRMTKMTNWTSFAGNAGARVTTGNYDAYRGWLNSKQYDDGNGPSYNYTDAGRLFNRWWARGTNTAYGYNTAGDLQTVIYNDSFTPGITNGFDWLGRLNIISNGPTVCTLKYNDAGEVVSEAYAGGTLDLFCVTNFYDSFLRRTTNGLLHNGTMLVISTNSFDVASRLAVISDGTNSATYSYLANSPLVSQIAFKQSGTTRMTTTNQYDHLNRLLSKTSGNGLSYSYQYNQANQRTEAILSDGSHWNYGYDSLGQVTGGKKYWSDWTPVAGEQFEYAFDDIGNRTSAAGGGDSTGAESSLRSASYTVNDLNQYTSRGVPGAVDITGDAWATATVTVNGNSAYRKGEFYDYALSVTNSSAAVWQSVTNQAVSGGTTTTTTGNIYVAKISEAFTYDGDGNLATDGRWSFVWDGENRLVQMLPLTNDPAASKRRLTFGYDFEGRRMSKQVENWDTNTSSWGTVLSKKYAYDGWNLLAELNGTNNVVICDYMWGTDLSGTPQGAGGVGGLLEATFAGVSATNCYVAFDGNGNVGGLVDAADGTTVARYEYGPFGELLRSSGVLARTNPFQFSTKYEDGESDLLYYGFRYYNANTGRWLNSDPYGEAGGLNLMDFVADDPINVIDYLGLKLTKDGGAQEILGGLANLQAACDKGCGFFHCCTKKHCKEEAAQLVQLLADAWTRNYGNGPYNDNAPGSDTVGGYFCWDWAGIFNNAVASTKFKCFSFTIGMAAAPTVGDGTPVHYYLQIYACKRKKDGFTVSFDDGFYDGSPVHSGPFVPPGGNYKPAPPLWPPQRPSPFRPAPAPFKPSPFQPIPM